MDYDGRKFKQSPGPGHCDPLCEEAPLLPKLRGYFAEFLRESCLAPLDEVMYDICMKGFVDGYYNWTAHGEAQVLENYDDQPAPICLETPVAPGMRTQRGSYEQMNWDQRMVYNIVGPQFFSMHQEPKAEGPSSSFPAGASSYDYDVSGLSERFFDVVQAVGQPLYSGCDHSQLAAVARLVNIKVEHNMFERCYDQDDIDMEYYKFCGDPRYKPTRDRNSRRKNSPYAVLSYNYTIQSSTRNVYEVRVHVPDDGNSWSVQSKAFDRCISGAFDRRVASVVAYRKEILKPRLIGEEIRVRVEEYSSAIKQPLIHPLGYGTDHKWTKKSIFWDISYWTTHLTWHNLDVIHIEKNLFANIFNTVMDVKGKSNDNLNARKDLTIICNRPELQVDERRPNVMPKAVYTLTKDHKRKVCEWVKCLRFPDGYASNLSRYVDVMELRLHGMKSHDCHIFMQKLISVAFREMVPEHVWSALTKVSLMF
ncbi:UNVERIFIED_CONTAM: hypothetical protein Scaly_2897300 [Sesamum calycinum]|uniref:Uncharacterized protein n=1 Tax=Sesamum calycinum TaxID=2727403 RepID=A0AAW2L703_9LAMI